MGMKSNKNKSIGIIFFTILTITAVVLMVYKNNQNKAVEAQLVLQAEKHDQSSKERLKAEEEKNKEEVLKKQEEQKQQEEKKKLEEQTKHEDAVKGIGKSKRIPVLMYHSIDYEKGNELRIPKDKFREQMKYLKDNGFNTLTLEELYSHITFGTDIPSKPVVITLDDGYDDNYTNAYDVLKELGLKATVFAITSTTDVSGDYLTSKQLKEMDANGMSIESHTVNHPKLNELSYEKQLEELKQSKDYLEKLLGREVKYIAYPYGNFNNDTLKAAKELGYKMAFTTKGGLAEKSNGIYKLNRIYVSDKHDMQKFKSMVNMK
jgi:peptidoglycan/xylan/chitin deacetylase (PgdA/CDA1 family)